MLAFIERFFKLKENNSNIKTEILSGITSFSTLAYALVLIPSILSQGGMEFGAVLVATVLVGIYASFLMGSLANYPFVIAPGVGLSAYLTYSVILGKGYPWQTALGIVFFTGVILVLLNLLRIRKFIIQIIPLSLRVATVSGLGFFLAFIGLKSAGIIVDHESTLVTFGNPHSIGHVMTALGLIIIGTLMAFRVAGAFFLGIVIIWLFSLVSGFVKWEGIVSMPTSLTPHFLKLDIKDAFQMSNLGIVLSLLFVTLFDATGSLLGLAEEGKFIKNDGKNSFPRISRALMPDATGTILSSLLGTSPATVYVESAAGINMGGRTGLSNLTVAILFFLTLFFTPFATSIPHYATAPVLLIIGAMMLRKMNELNWNDPSEWIPAFVTLILIPLTSSVANGLAAGYLVYCLTKLFSGKIKEVNIYSWILATLFILKFIFFPTT